MSCLIVSSHPRQCSSRSVMVIAIRHDTVNGADALTVLPASVHVTVCVPVPGFVVEEVP